MIEDILDECDPQTIINLETHEWGLGQDGWHHCVKCNLHMFNNIVLKNGSVKIICEISCAERIIMEII